VSAWQKAARARLGRCVLVGVSPGIQNALILAHDVDHLVLAHVPATDNEDARAGAMVLGGEVLHPRESVFGCAFFLRLPAIAWHLFCSACSTLVWSA
jgi:hypothetical protein